MAKKIAAIFVTMGLSIPAAAQVQTECSTYMGTASCVSREAPNGYPSDENASRVGGAIGAWLGNRQARRQEQAAYAEQQARMSDDALAQARRRAAAEMVADGKCSQARDMALKAGDLELAGQVKAAC